VEHCALKRDLAQRNKHFQSTVEDAAEEEVDDGIMDEASSDDENNSDSEIGSEYRFPLGSHVPTSPAELPFPDQSHLTEDKAYAATEVIHDTIILVAHK
jgi:hypothetical protein